MTVSDLLTSIRNQYNAIGDSFFSDAEIYTMIYNACMELALETHCIERTYTTTTVAGTQEYTFPTNVIAVKRITYDGKKLRPIDQRDDDAITGLNQSTTDQGASQYYWIWNDTISLRPIPSDAVTLKIWAFSMPSAVSATSTLETPSWTHLKLRKFCLAEMAAKDSNAEAAQYYIDRWAKDKADVKHMIRKRLRTDGFGAVKDIDLLNESWTGEV